MIVICAANEHYEKCGSPCVAKCNEPTPSVCTENCVKGCYCNEGFVRNSEDVCILPEECPALQR